MNKRRANCDYVAKSDSHYNVWFMDFVLVPRKLKSRESHASTVYAQHTLGRVAADMENANIAFSVC